jgi:hypothetical protein
LNNDPIRCLSTTRSFSILIFTLASYCVISLLLLRPSLTSGIPREPDFLSILGAWIGTTHSEAPGFESRRMPGPRRLQSCGTLNKAGATYELENDVSSPETCFSVEADHITLDLQGHSITYATSPRGLARFGISGIACWDPDLRPGRVAQGNPCSDHSSYFTVFGGGIAQAAGAAPYSHGIRIGQTNDGDHLTVHDVTLSLSAPASIPIYTTFTGAGSLIYNNTFHNNVTVIHNRHQQEGQSIKFNNTVSISPAQQIFGNTIVGGPQGGILTESPGSIIHDNSIAQDGRYSNDFAINLWASNQVAYNNKINATSGRGIFIDGIVAKTTGVSAYNNDIAVIELRRNQEYGGCELGGALGIQFDDGGSGTVYNNTVLARADECAGKGLRLTRVGANSTSHNNVYTAKRTDNSAAIAVAFSTGGATSFSSSHDTFTADTYNVEIDWDGGTGLTFQDDTFAKGNNPAANYATFSFRNAGTVPVTGIRFIDCAFLNGATKDTTDMQPVNAQNWPGPSEYFIEWTLVLAVADNKGNTVPGAGVLITDARGARVVKGSTDATGTFSAVLTEFRKFNTPSGVTREMNTPHVITISHDGCATSTFPLTIAGTTRHNVELNCER